MTAGIPDYDELALRIEPGHDGAYRVIASSSDGTATGGFATPFSDVELDNFILRVGVPRRSTRGFSSSQMEEAKRFGRQLFEAVMQGDVAEAYDGARGVATEHNRGIRIRLELSSVPELMEIPWEFLYDSPTFLAQSIYSPIVRSLDVKHARRPRRVSPPLRILGMISSPQGYPDLDVGAERAKLDTALERLRAQGLVELTWLEDATMAELNRVIGAPDEVHVLHFIGHGRYVEAADEGILVLEDAAGRPHEVKGEDLSSVLVDERSLRLAVLNSCEGARTSHHDPLAGVATCLVHSGIQAVVGMQFEITDEAAIAFSEQLYTTLSQGFGVDAALAQGRRAIFAHGHDVEFATPVLFLRGGDAKLFDVDVDAAVAPADVQPTRPMAAVAAAEAAPRSGWTARGRKTWDGLSRRQRRAAAVGAGLGAAAIVAASATVGFGGGDGRAAEHRFVEDVGAVLQKSRPSYFRINQVAIDMTAAAKDENAGIDLDDVADGLRDVISNRNDLAVAARSLDAPTALAKRVRTRLGAAFDRSVENDREIQTCLIRASSGHVANVNADCLASTQESSRAAGKAKDRFRASYNRLRSSLGLGASDPSF